MATRSAAIDRARPRWLRKHFALPAEHGAWIMFLGPFAVGAGVAWQWNLALVWVLVGMLALFVARQPLIILVKALAGRRPRSDVQPALVWLAIYGVVGLAAAGLLLAAGRAELFWLMAPALPALLWQLWLVTRRAERQMNVELAGSGALALAAPAAYIAATGCFDRIALVVWFLCWFQSAAAIVYVYLRLEQRRMREMPAPGLRWQMGWRPILYHAFNLAGSLVLAALGLVPALAPLAFGVLLAETVRGVARPAVGVKPQVLGMAQVGVTLVFAAILVLAYRV